MARREVITCDLCGDETERGFNEIDKAVDSAHGPAHVSIMISNVLEHGAIDLCRSCARCAVMEALNGNE